MKLTTRHTKLFLIILFVFNITSCAHLYGDKAFIKNRDKDYLKAQSIQPLKIPPGYSSDSFESLYPVPEKQYPPDTKDLDLTPPELNT